MLVQVGVVDGATAWSVLEFQGDVLAASGGRDALQLQGVDLGTLRYGHGRDVTLRIGNHVLAGHVQALTTPFAVLQRQDDHVDESGREPRTLYLVVGIARTRVVFASRPKPVLA